ncbi:MAG: hypothetical protein HY717_06755 [Planctomycetes bacterium]|nr:hypothetical protein [Planctomycetota bacterium]
MAFHLLRLVHWFEDVEGEKVELRYFRDPVDHEVNFVMLRKSKPWMAVEVKFQEQQLDANLKFLLERVKIPFTYQVSLNRAKDWRPPDINGCRIRVLPAAKFLARLP